MSPKFELWGGPEDGKEVAVRSGEVEHFVSIPRPPNQVPLVGAEFQPAYMRGRYLYSSVSKKFEWDGYEEDDR